MKTYNNTVEFYKGSDWGINKVALSLNVLIVIKLNINTSLNRGVFSFCTFFKKGYCLLKKTKL